MATVLRTPIRDIFLNVKATLMTGTGLGSDRVTIVAKPNIQSVADKEIQIWPSNATVDEAWEFGSGRRSCPIARNLNILCRDRVALDPTNESQVLLTDQNLGLFVLEEQVINALLEYLPVDRQGNALTTAPIKFLGQPAETAEHEEWANNLGWGDSWLVFQLVYQFSAVQNQYIT